MVHMKAKKKILEIISINSSSLELFMGIIYQLVLLDKKLLCKCHTFEMPCMDQTFLIMNKHWKIRLTVLHHEMLISVPSDFLEQSVFLQANKSVRAIIGGSSNPNFQASSVRHLWKMDTLGTFSISFTKGDNFCDCLVAAM